VSGFERAPSATFLAFFGGRPSGNGIHMHHFCRGCPILAFFARVGAGVACTILFVISERPEPHLALHSVAIHLCRRFQLPPFAKNAKDGAPTFVGDDTKIKAWATRQLARSRLPSPLKSLTSRT
jgi:hypothetical protein